MSFIRPKFTFSLIFCLSQIIPVPPPHTPSFLSHTPVCHTGPQVLWASRPWVGLPLLPSPTPTRVSSLDVPYRHRHWRGRYGGGGGLCCVRGGDSFIIFLIFRPKHTISTLFCLKPPLWCLLSVLNFLFLAFFLVSNHLPPFLYSYRWKSTMRPLHCVMQVKLHSTGYASH